MTEKKDYCYSYNGEIYRDTLSEALADMIENHNHHDGVLESEIYRGISFYPKASDFIKDIDLDEISENIYDKYLEFGESWVTA